MHIAQGVLKCLVGGLWRSGTLVERSQLAERVPS